jgi:hypothetical protein
MASTTDTATQLMTFVGGAFILAVGAALLDYARGVLKSDEREPGKGWRTMVAGIALCVLLLIFLWLASPTVLGSWHLHGKPQATLVLLSAAWLVALCLLLGVIINGRKVARYISEAYPSDEGPFPVKIMRQVLRV